jgi:hypothetical protein
VGAGGGSKDRVTAAGDAEVLIDGDELALLPRTKEAIWATPLAKQRSVLELVEVPADTEAELLLELAPPPPPPPLFAPGFLCSFRWLSGGVLLIFSLADALAVFLPV